MPGGREAFGAAMACMTDVRCGFQMRADDVTASIAIRRFFLYPHSRYALRHPAAIWRVPPDDVLAMFSDVLNEPDLNGSDPLAFEAPAAARETAMAFHVFRWIEIEQALGEDCERACPEEWRTIPLLIHVPRFTLDGLAACSFLPEPESLAARAERLLCEVIELDRAIGGGRDEVSE